MNPPQSGTSLTGDAVQTIGGRNTRGDKSDSPGRRNEIFPSTHTCGRIVPSGAGRGTHVVCGSACLPRQPGRQARRPAPPATEYTGSRGNPVTGVVAANVPCVPRSEEHTTELQTRRSAELLPTSSTARKAGQGPRPTRYRIYRLTG